MNFSANSNAQRVHYLDAVRAFALFLGIVFHASLSFVPVFIGWAVMDISTSDTVGYFIHISHSFRMPLFFLLAGFFSHLVINKKTLGYFVYSRITRIAIPFIVGWFFLRPLLVAGWVLGADSMRGNVDLQHALEQALQTFTELPSSLFVGTHLWFLYYLMLLSALLIGTVVALNKRTKCKKRLNIITLSFLSFIEQRPWAIFVLVVPTSGFLWFMNTWGLDTPDKSLLPHWQILGLYGLFFFAGFTLFVRPIALEKITSKSKLSLMILLLSVPASIWLSRFEANSAIAHYLWYKTAFHLSYAFMMWSLIILSLTFGKRLFSKPNRVIQYLANASFWLYFIHLPVVVFLQVAFAEFEIHWLYKLTGISLLTIVFSLVLYELIIKTSWLKHVFVNTNNSTTTK